MDKLKETWLLIMLISLEAISRQNLPSSDNNNCHTWCNWIFDAKYIFLQLCRSCVTWRWLWRSTALHKYFSTNRACSLALGVILGCSRTAWSKLTFDCLCLPKLSRSSCLTNLVSFETAYQFNVFQCMDMNFSWPDARGANVSVHFLSRGRGFTHLRRLFGAFIAVC